MKTICTLWTDTMGVHLSDFSTRLGKNRIALCKEIIGKHSMRFFKESDLSDWRMCKECVEELKVMEVVEG